MWNNSNAENAHNAEMYSEKDRHRHGFRYICRNSPKKRRFDPYNNTFLANVRPNEKMGEDRIIMLMFLLVK